MFDDHSIMLLPYQQATVCGRNCRHKSIYCFAGYPALLDKVCRLQIDRRQRVCMLLLLLVHACMYLCRGVCLAHRYMAAMVPCEAVQRQNSAARVVVVSIKCVLCVHA